MTTVHPGSFVLAFTERFLPKTWTHVQKGIFSYLIVRAGEGNNDLYCIMVSIGPPVCEDPEPCGLEKPSGDATEGVADAPADQGRRLKLQVGRRACVVPLVARDAPAETVLTATGKIVSIIRGEPQSVAAYSNIRHQKTPAFFEVP